MIEYGIKDIVMVDSKGTIHKGRSDLNPTKERLTNPWGEIKSHMESCGIRDGAWLAQKILNTPDIIDPIIEAQLAKNNLY